MKLLSVYSPSDLARHYFSSNLYGEQQLDAAYEALESCHGLNTTDQWETILGAVHSLPWVTHPKDVTIAHLEMHGIVDLCSHFWNSELDSNLAESILNASFGVVEKQGDDMPAWLLVREIAENYYEDWENETIRRQTIQANTCRCHHIDCP